MSGKRDRNAQHVCVTTAAAAIVPALFPGRHDQVRLPEAYRVLYEARESCGRSARVIASNLVSSLDTW